MFLASLALALQPAPSPAPDSLEWDLQCLSVIAAARQQGLPEAQLMPLSTFYVGRVSGRGSSSEAIKAKGAAVQAQMQGKELAPLYQACGERLQEEGRRLSTLSREANANAPAPTGDVDDRPAVVR